MHESFNATVAESFAASYDRHYFGGRPTISRDTVVAAALYHDMMKTVVFGWNDDGTPFDELTIAGTGGHHVLSGAEALARGHDARFVTTLLSAHAAPSLGDESKVVAWCRAAAIVAGVDPVAYGLVKPAGANFVLAADPVPIEAFVNFLSDHDYVLSVHAMHVVAARLQAALAAAGRALIAGADVRMVPLDDPRAHERDRALRRARARRHRRVRPERDAHRVPIDAAARVIALKLAVSA